MPNLARLMVLGLILVCGFAQGYEPPRDVRLPPVPFHLTALSINNDIRISEGKPPQSIDSRLMRAAQTHAEHLAASGYTVFSGPSGHDGFGNGNVATRAAACGFRGDLDENLGVNYDSLHHAFRCFSDPVRHGGHRRALLAAHDRCGFGQARNSKGELIVVCVYGTESK